MKHAYPEIKGARDNRAPHSDKSAVSDANRSASKNNDYFRLVAENARDLIFISRTSPTYRFDYVSPSSTHITGYTPEEFYADPFLAKKSILPEDFPLVTDPSAWDGTQKNKPVEIRWRRKDGRIIWTEHMITVTRDKHGNPETFQIIARDITERKQAEEAIQLEKNKMQSVIDAMSDGLTILDTDYNIIFQNEPARAVTNGNCIGEKCYRVYENRDKVCDGCPVELAFKDGKSHTSERKRTIPSGEITIWENTANPIRDADGNILTCLEIGRNITERKKAENALQESQKFASSLLDKAPHATMVINPDTSVEYVNPIWECLNGWTLSEIVGTKVPYPWWPSEFKKAFTEGFIEAMKQGSGKAEVISQKKNGELYWIDMNWASVTNNGELQYLLINSVDITERKRMEAALSESEEKFSKAFNSSPNAVCIVSTEETKFIEINESFLRFTGYTREEVIGHTPLELGLWVNEEDLKRIDKKLRETHRLDNEEVKSRIKTGEIHTGLFSAETIDIGGKKCMLLVITDITEQIHTQEALKESKEKYQELISTSFDGIISLDAHMKITIWNQGAERIFGYTEKEMLGESIFKIVPEDYREPMMKQWKIPEESGLNPSMNRTFETFGLRKDQTVIPIDLSVTTRRVGGDIIATAIIRDISERKRMEKALRESEEKFSKAFHASPVMVAITTIKDGKYIDVNDSYALNTGYSRDELIGKTTAAMHIWANADDRTKVFNILKEQERVHNAEFDFRMKSGEIRTWIFSLEPITIGEEPCLIGVSLDITERKRMEESLANEAIRRRILIEQSRDGIVILDQNGAVYEANRRFAEMLGYSREEISKLNVWDWEYLYPPERVLEMIRTVDEAGDHFETQHRRKDGSVYDVEISTNGATFAGQKLIFCVCRDITERKQMEKALRESEEKFSAAFRSSPDMMCIVNLRDGKYTDVNDSFVHVLGYSREELIGHQADEFNLWQNPEEAEKMTRLMQEQGEVKHEEYHFRTKSGEMRTWLCSADTLTIGGDPCMLAVATDITERKKARQALQESEEKFSKAFNASPISLSISRLSDGMFLEVNESFLRNKGYTREEVIGHSSKKLNIWANQSEQNRVIQMLQERGHVHNEQVQYRTKSGYMRTGLLSAETISIANESCMLVMNNDVTQQKLAEEQLRILSSVTQQVSDSTIITDSNFNITYMNQAAQNLFGYTIEEVRGKELGFFNKTPISDSKKQEIFKTASNGKSYSSKLIKQCKDGSTLICLCRLSPLYDEKGQICSYIDVQRDITKQEEMEAKLQEHKKLIESILATMPEGVLVIDRNSRIILANKALHRIFHFNKTALKNMTLGEIFPPDQFYDLNQAVKSGLSDNNSLEFRYQTHDLEKIIYCVVVKMDGERTLITFTDISKERDEEEKLYLTDRLASIGEMAAGLAHELNNPLTGILALSQLLMGSDMLAEHKEDLECIHSEAKRAASIVKNVLLFARNKTEENGRSSVNDVVKDVLRLREYEERASNITVVTNLEKNLPDIPIDKGQLQQAFLNIISNAEAAIKEAKRPGVLTVATQRANNHINISFSDNGCGIKKQIMPRIFDPFFTTKEIGKGTGLGLSICYSIIVKHGGKISVKSQVNEGSTFTIKMPIAV
jgi:PAS domain S-box-containing protein